MSARADIAAFSRDKRPILAVDIKGGRAYSTRESAAAVRRNLIMHGLFPSAPFYMLATPINFYLWPQSSNPVEPPRFCAAAGSILDRYAAPWSTKSVQRREGALEIVIFSWLSDLMSGIRPPVLESAADQIMIDSGVYQQIQGGAAEYEVQL